MMKQCGLFNLIVRELEATQTMVARRVNKPRYDFIRNAVYTQQPLLFVFDKGASKPGGWTK